MMVLLYQCEVVLCAIFLTGQASNPLIAKFAHDQHAGLDIGYARWLAGGIVPGLVSLAVVPLLLFRLFPPEVTHTPEAPALAAAELAKMGTVARSEILMLGVFTLVAGLWMTKALHGIDYSVVGLVGISTLLLTQVLDWSDVLEERGAWDVFIWYGGLVRMGEALGESGLTRRFAEAAGSVVGGTALGPRGDRPSPLLLLRALRLRFGHRPLHRDVRGLPRGHDGGRRARDPLRAPARLLLEPLRVPHPLRHHPGPDPLRSGLREPARLVAARASFARCCISSCGAPSGPLWWRFLGWW